MRPHLLAVLLVGLNSAACASRSVLYNPVTIPPNPPSTRVVFDRWGDLYPAVPVDLRRLAAAGDSLSGYYDRAARADDLTEWNALLRAYGVAPGTDFLQVWQAVQDSIVARTVREATAAAGTGPLLVLIHGYNNNEAEAWTAYSYARAVARQKGYPAGVLEVYWDGRTDTGSKLRNPDAWGRGQHNAYGVGLGLRRIFNTLPGDVPVRILTHSHGGKIAAVALWNVTSAIPRTREVWRTWYDSLRMDTVRYRTPTHRDVRIAMIAPAMPGNVIRDHYGSDSSTTPVGSRMPLARLIVGQNRRDRVVQKRFIFGIPLPAVVGSTTLGGRTSEYNQHAAGFNHPGRKPVAFCVDFSGREGPHPGAHGWIEYMQRPAVGELLDLLFQDEPPPQRYPCTRRGQP